MLHLNPWETPGILPCGGTICKWRRAWRFYEYRWSGGLSSQCSTAVVITEYPEARNVVVEPPSSNAPIEMYDPNANASAESSVGILKRRARYLLSGCRLPTAWWGVATLAAAQLCRQDAGLEEYPRIPFGTRAMLVRDPTPKNAFAPRALPATVFGPSASVPTG